MNTIPRNLNDCIAILDEQTPPNIVEKLKDGSLSTTDLHHTLGRSMRNTWNLWEDSVLHKWFKNRGIFHADDMSGIIMDSFVRHLKGEPIDFDGQVKFYQDYWEKMKSKPKKAVFECFQRKNGKWDIR